MYAHEHAAQPCSHYSYGYVELHILSHGHDMYSWHYAMNDALNYFLKIH